MPALSRRQDVCRVGDDRLGDVSLAQHVPDTVLLVERLNRKRVDPAGALMTSVVAGLFKNCAVAPLTLMPTLRAAFMRSWRRARQLKARRTGRYVPDVLMMSPPYKGERPKSVHHKGEVPVRILATTAV